MDHCEELAKLIPDVKERDGSAGVPHPRECVPATVQELIIGWLGGMNLVSMLTGWLAGQGWGLVGWARAWTG